MVHKIHFSGNTVKERPAKSGQPFPLYISFCHIYRIPAAYIRDSSLLGTCTHSIFGYSYSLCAGIDNQFIPLFKGSCQDFL